MSRSLETFIGRLRRSAAGPNHVTDAELLARFVRSRDAAAFELLFWRHGPMVWGVCRRVLGNAPDAEDAFQAAFVVLARKAHAVGSGGALAAWLHRVAWRTALNARSARARRTARECLPGALPDSACGPDPAERLAAGEVQAAIDEELARLSETYRRPLILCDLEARPHAAAAAELGCPLGTLHSRLARGREKLRSRLLRRGFAPAFLTAVAVPSGVASAALAALARPPAEPIRALADGAIRALAVAAAKKMAAAVTVGCVLAAGIALGTAAGRDTPQVPAAAPPIARAVADDGSRFLDPDAGPLPADAVARIGSPRLRHAGKVTGLAYSPDGKWLASTSTDPADATARLWEAATGKEQQRIKITAGGQGRPDSVAAIGFSADGRQFLVADVKLFRAFDIATGQEVIHHQLSIYGHRDNRLDSPLIGVGIVPGGKSLVLAWDNDGIQDNGRFEIRDAATGVVRGQGDHPWGRYAAIPIVFSPDGRRFTLGASAGGAVPVYDTGSGERLGQIQPEGKSVSSLGFLPDGQTLVGLLNDPQQALKPTIGFFEVKTGRLARTADVNNTTYVLAVSPDGKLLVAGNGQRSFSQVIDVETGKEIGRLPSMPSLNALAFSADSKLLAGARYSGGAITVWDMARRTYHATAPEPASFYGVAFSPDGQALMLPGQGRPSVDWRTGRVVHRRIDLKTDGAFVNICLSPDGTLFAMPVTNGHGPIRLLDADSGKELRTLTGHTDLANSMTFSRDGRRLATCGFDKKIRVWDVTTGRELAVFAPPEAFGADQLSLSADGRVLAATFTQNLRGGTVIVIWDVDARAQRARIEAPTFFSPAHLSPDGRLVAGGGGQARQQVRGVTASDVLIWDAATGRTLHTLPGHVMPWSHSGGASCTFSPDSRLLATGDAAGHLRLWEVTTGQEVHHFDGHHSYTGAAGFSPDGRLLVAASEDAPCFVWSVVGTESGPAKLTDPDQLWRDLADADAVKAFRAIRRLVASPEPAAELVRKNLRPAVGVDRGRVEKLVRDLDSDTFAVREAATMELTKLADRIGPTLVKARAGASAEARTRLDRIMDRSKLPPPDRLREDRAVQALELIGPPATAVLAELAAGAPEDRLTLAALAARDRLRRRGPG
jgi:RNA polymerase sigma factor (sigma-70 family)